jgi:hypothetical protein
MSLLPQRKKTAEEIAKLRETLGVPALSEEPPAAQDTLVPAHHEAIVEHHPDAPEPENPAPATQNGPKPVHSLKRSEHIPPPEPEEPKAPKAVHIDVSHLAKPVRSLRKSEQVPVLVPAPAPSGDDPKIPVHRKSDEEIADIRRREALAMLSPPPPNPKLAAAHPALLAPAYLCAIAGASCFVFDGFPIAATAACSIVALSIAGFVFARRPISRHHAGFIAVITLFILVFGALHYFPQLQHAT